MDKRERWNLRKPSSFKVDNDFDDMMTVMESDLEDYEVAAELGISPIKVSMIRRELFED
ncbi:MAG: hypothetical protein WBL93_01815 [Lutisporaceae bacterium]